MAIKVNQEPVGLAISTQIKNQAFRAYSARDKGSSSALIQGMDGTRQMATGTHKVKDSDTPRQVQDNNPGVGIVQPEVIADIGGSVFVAQAKTTEQSALGIKIDKSA